MTKSKTKPVRRMWAHYMDGHMHLTSHKQVSIREAGSRKWFTPKFHPVYVVDARKEAMTELVEKVAQVTMAWERNRYGRLGNSNTETYRMAARAALAAIFKGSKGAK